MNDTMENGQLTSCPWRIVGVSDETWRRWRKKGLTPKPIDMPGRPLYLIADVLAWLASKQQQTQEVAP